MPADPARKIVVARMFPEAIQRLDLVCVAEGTEVGRPVNRSVMINMLVEAAYGKLPRRFKAKKSK